MLDRGPRIRKYVVTVASGLEDHFVVWSFFPGCGLFENIEGETGRASVCGTVYCSGVCDVGRFSSVALRSVDGGERAGICVIMSTVVLFTVPVVVLSPQMLLSLAGERSILHPPTRDSLPNSPR
jgi:hypothetical protein